ncbi:uncharacterized protein LOC144341044 [Macaca mulatta]
MPSRRRLRPGPCGRLTAAAGLGLAALSSRTRHRRRPWADRTTADYRFRRAPGRPALWGADYRSRRAPGRRTTLRRGLPLPACTGTGAVGFRGSLYPGSRRTVDATVCSVAAQELRESAALARVLSFRLRAAATPGVSGTFLGLSPAPTSRKRLRAWGSKGKSGDAGDGEAPLSPSAAVPRRSPLLCGSTFGGLHSGARSPECLFPAYQAALPRYGAARRRGSPATTRGTGAQGPAPKDRAMPAPGGEGTRLGGGAASTPPPTPAHRVLPSEREGWTWVLRGRGGTPRFALAQAAPGVPGAARAPGFLTWAKPRPLHLPVQEGTAEGQDTKDLARSLQNSRQSWAGLADRSCAVSQEPPRSPF